MLYAMQELTVTWRRCSKTTIYKCMKEHRHLGEWALIFVVTCSAILGTYFSYLAKPLFSPLQDWGGSIFKFLMKCAQQSAWPIVGAK